MRKILLPVLLLAAILTACTQAPQPSPSPSPTPSPIPTATATPTPTPSPSLTAEATFMPTEEPTEIWGFPIDDTHDAFEVDTKGKLGTVLVTVEIEDIDPEEYHFSVWAKDDLTTPIQTMKAESYGVFHWGIVQDANFDGYMDFGYMYAMGNQPRYWHYWIWNEAKGRFVQEPEFDQISEPQFNEETGIISGYARSSAASGTATFHCWENGKLVCIREVEVCYPNWGESQDLVVRDRIDGELVEVFRKTFGPPEDNGPIYDEAVKWYDLSYHGK